MTTDHEVDGIIEELRAGLREQQSVLAAQTERIAMLEGQRRSSRTACPTADDVPERRPRRLTRGGMLKAAAMGDIATSPSPATATGSTSTGTWRMARASPASNCMPPGAA